MRRAAADLSGDFGKLAVRLPPGVIKAGAGAGDPAAELLLRNFPSHLAERGLAHTAHWACFVKMVSEIGIFGYWFMTGE
jgi:hypothetical protein